MPIAPGGPIISSAFAQASFHGDAVQDTAALTALLPAERFDKQERFVEDDNETYYFDLQSTAASSPPDILVPDDSPAAGRWIKLSPSGGVPATHAATHIRAGTDEVDGDKLDIDFTPANYTPDTSPAEVTNVDELTAHLKGIDDQLTGGITLPVVDTTSIVEGSADATKEMRIEVDGLTTATVRVLTMPDKDIEPDDKGDARTPTTHSFAGAEHSVATLASVNSKISDATLIDTGDSRLSDARTPLAHRASHISGGSDAFLSTDLLEATIKRVLESDGPTTLTVGAIIDGEFLKRVGATIVSAVAGGDTLPVVDTTAIVKGSADATKLVRIEADGLTTATTRTLTMPDANITPDDVGGRRGVDSAISLASDWNVGNQQITGLAGLDPNGDGVDEMGTPGNAWGTLLIRNILPDGGNSLIIANSVGTEVIRIMTTVVAFSDAGADIDFRFEGDTDPDLLTTDAGLDRVGVGVALGAHLAKFHVAGGILGELDVEAVASTPHTVVALESRRVFTNEGGTAEIVHNLPSAAGGGTYSYIIQDADGIRVNAAAGDTLRIGATVSAAAGRIQSTTIGDTVTLVAINATEWVALGMAASNWTVDGTSADIGGGAAGAVLADGTVSLTADWGVGNFLITGLGGLRPTGDDTQDIGRATQTWRRVYTTEIRDTADVLVFHSTSGGTTFNDGAVDHDFRAEGDTDPNLLTTDAGLERVGVGIALGGHLAKLHVDQFSTSAAIPVLLLDQADVSEEMIEFVTTIGVGNAIEAIGAKSLTTTHFVKISIPGGLTRYIPVGTIA